MREIRGLITSICGKVSIIVRCFSFSSEIVGTFSLMPSESLGARGQSCKNSKKG